MDSEAARIRILLGIFGSVGSVGSAVLGFFLKLEPALRIGGLLVGIAGGIATCVYVGLGVVIRWRRVSKSRSASTSKN